MADILRLERVSKSFGNCRALSSASLTVYKGDIHFLLGDAGSGKTTLANIIAGRYYADKGEFFWDGKLVTSLQPKWVRQKYWKKRTRIALINSQPQFLQDLNLIENIAVLYKIPFSKKNCKDILITTLSIIASHGFSFSPQQPIKDLSTTERVEADMVRALYSNPLLLVIDGADDFIPLHERNRFLSLIKEWQQQGITILYCGDTVDEVFDMADEVTVLKQGRKLLDFDPTKKKKKEIMQLLGDGLLPAKSVSHLNNRKVILQLQNLYHHPASQVNPSLPAPIPLSDINLTLHEGEIIGIIGLPHNGEDEMFKLLSGEWTTEPAAIRWQEKEDIGDKDFLARRKRHFGFMPYKRREMAVANDLDVFDNTLLSFLARPQARQFGFINKPYIKNTVQHIIKKYDLPLQYVEHLLTEVSTDDLHKYILGREVLLAPDILVVQGFSRGVGKTITQQMHHALFELAERGAGIIVFSQDIDEIFLLADNIYFLTNGMLSTAFATKDHNKNFIESLLVGFSSRQDQSAQANNAEV